MAKRVMERKAADNKYLHRDFHKSMDLGLAYLGANYGDEGVEEYLRDFALGYYAPLIERIRQEGLQPLYDHIAGIYEAEEAAESLSMNLSPARLDVTVSKCPAIAHFHKIGYTASPWYVEATRTVNQTIADTAGLEYVQHCYDEADGHSEYSFIRRDAR